MKAKYQNADLFAPGPARDGRFNVVETWEECDNFERGDPRRDLEFLHRQMNEEVNGLECAARNIADFPDAPWELRMQIARQVYDEARHVEKFSRRYRERGGKIGAHPVLNFQYRIITNIDSLPGRLTIQNRLFEAEGVDAIEWGILDARDRDEEELAELFEFQLADEIGHVRFANEYIIGAIKENPALVMDIGRSMDRALRAFNQVVPKNAHETPYGISEQGRLEAGFLPDEIERVRSKNPTQRAESENVL